MTALCAGFAPLLIDMVDMAGRLFMGPGHGKAVGE